MADLKISTNMTAKELISQFRAVFGGTLRIYNGQHQVNDDTLLSSITNAHVSDCGISGDGLTVGQFEDVIKSRLGFKVQVATCDDWVLVLDTLPLSTVASIKKNATKAYMQTLINSDGNINKVDSAEQAPEQKEQISNVDEKEKEDKTEEVVDKVTDDDEDEWLDVADSIVFNGIYYDIWEDGTATASSVEDEQNGEKLVIPETITDEDGNIHEVTSFGLDFYDVNCKILSLPKTLKTIYATAFDGISDTLKKSLQIDLNGNANIVFEDGAFYSIYEGCKNLANIKLLADVSKKFVVPDGIKGILGGAFDGNEIIEEIDIPSSVIMIQPAFDDCENLKVINIHNDKDAIKLDTLDVDYVFPENVEINFLGVKSTKEINSPVEPKENKIVFSSNNVSDNNQKEELQNGDNKLIDGLCNIPLIGWIFKILRKFI